MIKFFGGGETHSLKLYQTLLQNNNNANILVPCSSELAKILKQQKLNFHTTMALNYFPKFKLFYKIILAKDIYKICKSQNIKVIICNAEHELSATKLVAKILPIKIVFTRHLPNQVKNSRIKGIDGIIAVNPAIQTMLQSQNKKNCLGIKHIEFIAPFFNDESMLCFKTSETKEDFFKNNFGITINNSPILCMAANMYPDNRKNQIFLITAIHKIVHERNKQVQLMLAGSGELLEKCKQLIAELNLQEHVHLLGFTKNIPDLLYHSDINILPSKEEGLGIVLLEAALLKKPLIGTAGTGMETVIKHNETGLLFDLNNIDDLVEKIEALIDDKQLQKNLGQNAFDFVSNNFLTNAKLQKLNVFLDVIISG